MLEMVRVLPCGRKQSRGRFGQKCWTPLVLFDGTIFYKDGGKPAQLQWSSVEFTPLTDRVVGGTRGTIQQTSSFSLFFGRALWEILTWAIFEWNKCVTGASIESTAEWNMPSATVTFNFREWLFHPAMVCPLLAFSCHLAVAIIFHLSHTHIKCFKLFFPYWSRSNNKVVFTKL